MKFLFAFASSPLAKVGLEAFSFPFLGGSKMDGIRVPISFVQFFRDRPNGGWLALLLAEIYQRASSATAPINLEEIGDLSCTEWMDFHIKALGRFPQHRKLLWELDKFHLIDVAERRFAVDSEQIDSYLIRLWFDQLHEAKLVDIPMLEKFNEAIQERIVEESV